MFRKILSFLMLLTIVFSLLTGITGSSSEIIKTLNTNNVIQQATQNGIYSDATELEDIVNKRKKLYYIFDNIENISGFTRKSFKVYSKKGTKAVLSCYVFDKVAPEGIDTDTWNSHLTEVTPTEISDTSCEYDSTNNILSWDISSLSISDGQSLIIMVPESGVTGEEIGGGANTTCPPQITGIFNEETFNLNIVSKFNNAADNAAVIKLLKTYDGTLNIDLNTLETLGEDLVAGQFISNKGSFSDIGSIKSFFDNIAISVRGEEKSISADESYSENLVNYFEFNKNPYASAMMMTEFRATLDGSLENAQAVAKIGENEFTGMITLDNDTLKVAFDFENLTDGCDIMIEISGLDGELSESVLWFIYDKEGYENKILNLINNALKEELEEILFIYCSVLEIDMALLNDIYKLGVMEILADTEFTSISEIADAYINATDEIKEKYTNKEIIPDKTIAVGNKVLYVFEDAFEVKYAVDKVFSLSYGENVEVKYYSSDDEIPENNLEGWLSDKKNAATYLEEGNVYAFIDNIAGKNIVIETIAGDNATLKFKYDKKTFETTILSEVNNASENNVTDTVIKYKKLFGITTEIPANADMDMLNSELANTEFKSFDEINPAFEVAIKKAVAPKKIMYASKVIATAKNNYNTFEDVTKKLTVERYQRKVYYVFENIRYAGRISDIVFKVAGTDKGDGKISVYKISGNAPDSTDSEKWQAVLSNENRIATNILYKSTSPLIYKIPDINLSDGDTIILYVPNTDSRSIGSGGHSTYPPQITFKHKIRIFDKNIISAAGEIKDFNNVPVVSKYSFDFISVGKIDTDTLKNSFAISKSGGAQTALTAKVTETPYNNGDYYIYTVSFDIPMLDYNTNYSIKFNQNTVDEFGNGFADTSFDFTTEESSFTYSNGTVTANKNVKLLFGETTYSSEILNSLAIDIVDMTASSTPVTGVSGIVFELMGTNPFEAKKSEGSFVKVTDADAQRVNKKIEINAGIGNMPILAAVLPMTDAVLNAGENDVISVTEADLESNAKMFAETISNASGVASIVWTVPNTTSSGDYVLYVKRNNGYADVYYSFYYKNPSEQDSAIDTLSDANTTKAQFETALTSNKKLLGVDLTEYNALPQGKDDVISALYENRSNITGEAVLKEMFDKEVLTQQINNITDDTVLKTTLLANKAEYGIESSEIYTKVYGSQLATYGISESLVFDELATYNITKAEDMLRFFELAILKTALTNLANYRNSYDIVSSVSGTLGIDFTSYNNLGSNKDSALSKFVTAMATVTELSGIKGAFDTSVSITTPGTTTITPSAGGGGGGYWKPDKNLTVANMNEDKMEEVPQVENKPIFNDVTASHWAYSFIDRLSGSGFVNGYTDGNFNPDNYITRGEFITVVTRAFGIDNSEAVCSFMDVDKESWYYPYIASAYQKGIVSGINYDFFAPERNISRQDAAVIIVNLYKYLGAYIDASNLNFTDNKTILDYARNSVGYLMEKGVINGYTDGSFRPYNDITRAETCKIISLAIDIRWTVTK